MGLRVTRRAWVALPDEKLLDLRVCDLGLRVQGSALEGRLARLFAELEAAGLHFRPYTWLSTGWYTPHGFTGFAIPFFLAHPRLVRLERRQAGEVEGGDAAGCMRLLRHEAGHTLDNAYRLHRRRSWRERFGASGVPYHASYRPTPGSRRYVRNLDHWYAQSHPIEDFAETFAVWLAPRSAWRARYAGWPALRKLEYVDALLREIRDQRPPVRTRERMDPVGSLRITLREYYRRRRARIGRRRASREYHR